MGIPLPKLTGPPDPQQSPPIEYRGNAGIREASQVRANRPSKGSTLRVPHAPTTLGKGTPHEPPQEAVGAYPTTYGMDRAIASQHQAQRITAKESTSDRSRSRDPPGDIAPVVPIAQPQVVMHVPNYLLPIMATAGVGHLTLDRSGVPSGGVTAPPATKASEPSIRDFFESFSQAQDREAKVKAIQQFTAELLNEPQESASPAPQETPTLDNPTSIGVVGGRMSSSPAQPHDATAAFRESSSPRETERQEVRSSPEGRGRRPSITERVRSYWPSLKSITGSDRRPKSPQIPPRPERENAPKRANSMPRLSDSTSAQPDSSTT